MRYTICLVTNWYPNEANPFRGVFFKEQAIAVAEAFDFVVVHYTENIKKNPFKKDKTVKKEEYNIVEYTIDTYIPISCFLADYIAKKIESLKILMHPEKSVIGTGRYTSKREKNRIRKTITKVFDRDIHENIDAFYCVDAQTEAYNVQCLAEHYHKPYVVGEHAPVPWPGTLISDINKIAIEKADAFIAISYDKIRQLMIQNIKLPKTVYLGNLVDEDSLPLKIKADDRKTLLIVAANSFYKNYDMFISVMNRLAEITDEPHRIMIVGYASNKGYSMNVDKFEDEIKRTKFAAYTVLIPSVPHDEIGRILIKADAFVMTSIQEGQPVSALEAACCGLPIFSTRCGGVEDYVDDSVGRLYNLTDIEGFAQGLKDYLEGRITFDSNHIRQHVVSIYGKENFKTVFETTFNKVIRRNETKHSSDYI